MNRTIISIEVQDHGGKEAKIKSCHTQNILWFGFSNFGKKNSWRNTSLAVADIRRKKRGEYYEPNIYLNTLRYTATTDRPLWGE